MVPSERKWWALGLVNGLTLSRLFAGVLSAVAFFSELLKPFLSLSLLYILVSDLLDGMLARRLAVTTRAGGVFDYVVDRFNYYLMVSILIHEGVPPLLLLPYFVRDLLYVSVQVYMTIPSVRGTKAASFSGTAAAYAYVLTLNYWKMRNPVLDAFLFLALTSSLANLLLRIYRLRGKLVEALKEDLFS